PSMGNSIQTLPPRRGGIPRKSIIRDNDDCRNSHACSRFPFYTGTTTRNAAGSWGLWCSAFVGIIRNTEPNRVLRTERVLSRVVDAAVSRALRAGSLRAPLRQERRSTA